MQKMSELTNTILSRRQAAEDYLKEKRALWDKAEQLFHGQLNDSISSGARSQVFDPKLATLTIERSYRVMAQLGTGKVRGISRNDMGDAQLKNLILDKYVVPNANAQFDFLTKLRMVDLYSNIYGNFFTLTDWDVRPNGYIGPDIWLLNIRDVFPQVGAVSLEDSDYVIVRTWKSISYFDGLAKQKGYKNIPAILTKLKDASGSKQDRDARDISKREQDQYPQQTPAKNSGYFEVLTMYERDRWVDYCVDADFEFRDIPNPHDNGELPVDCKYSLPLLDDPMGMGDFERGGSMQMAMNGNWNLYFDALKMSIFPPIIINKDNVATASSFQMVPAAKWFARGAVNNVAQPLQLTPQGISTFNNTYQVTNAALLNLFGTSDTTVSTQTDPGMGKTPEALKMQGARENTRDNADRFYMEQYVTKIMKKMVNLLAKKQSKAIAIRMFPDEIDVVSRSYPEIKDIYNEKTGKITIGKGKSGSTLYDYELVSGSTFAIDKKQQQEFLSMLLGLWMQSNTPQGNILANTLKQEGFNFKIGEVVKGLVAGSGIQDWDKILQEQTEGEKGNVMLDNSAQQFQQVLQQMGGGQPNMNAIPPQPGQPGQQGQQGQQQLPQQQPLPQDLNQPMDMGNLPPQGAFDNGQ